jgi:hypothetical protein
MKKELFTQNTNLANHIERSPEFYVGLEEILIKITFH